MSHDVENITPYDDSQGHKTEQVRDMFDNIAPAYDLMNRAMTMGIDKLWRARAVRLIAAASPRDILDVATGTGDLAICLARRLKPRSVKGIDLSAGMIGIGRDKVQRAGLQDVITLEQGDCLALPYDDASFDCVTVAYGVRNFEHLEAGYREMARVLRPGGQLCVIELSTPRSRPVRAMYDLYTLHLIPAVGRLVSHDADAYRYLPRSIAAVPQRDDMCRLMTGAGLTDARWHSLTFGTCMIYTATKPR